MKKVNYFIYIVYLFVQSHNLFAETIDIDVSKKQVFGSIIASNVIIFPISVNEKSFFSNGSASIDSYVMSSRSDYPKKQYLSSKSLLDLIDKNHLKTDLLNYFKHKRFSNKILTFLNNHFPNSIVLIPTISNSTKKNLNEIFISIKIFDTKNTNNIWHENHLVYKSKNQNNTFFDPYDFLVGLTTSALDEVLATGYFFSEMIFKDHDENLDKKSENKIDLIQKQKEFIEHYAWYNLTDILPYFKSPYSQQTDN